MRLVLKIDGDFYPSSSDYLVRSFSGRHDALRFREWRALYLFSLNRICWFLARLLIEHLMGVSGRALAEICQRYGTCTNFFYTPLANGRGLWHYELEELLAWCLLMLEASPRTEKRMELESIYIWEKQAVLVISYHIFPIDALDFLFSYPMIESDLAWV